MYACACITYIYICIYIHIYNKGAILDVNIGKYTHKRVFRSADNFCCKLT